jgi:hypothetical protein
MPTSKVTMQSLFPGLWGATMPSTMVELVNADYDSLDPLARDLRALAMQMVHAFERKPIHTARAAMELLEAHHLSAPKGKWNIVALGVDRERIYERAAGTNLRLVHLVSSTLPDAKTLTRKAPVPEGGTYLIIRGGSPAVLEDETSLQSYRNLKQSVSVADVILWDDQSDVANFWSIGAGAGQRGSVVISFPDQDLLETWRNT